MSEPKPRITPTKTSTERKRLAHNYSLLWVDANIDENNNDCQNTLTRLRAVVNDVNLCTQPTDSIQFFNTIGDEKAFVITSGSLGQHLVPDIHDIPNLNSIYIFCGDKSRHEQWTKQWIKIKGVHTDIKYICEALQTDVKQCNQDLTSISFVGSTEGTNSENLNQLDPTFMYTQIFKDILLEMKHDQKAIQDLTEHCRALYIENKHELDIIKEFERTYRAEQAIWWYTRQCFTFQMLNRALRNLESDTIIKMGFFMCDLHKQIAELHQQQIDSHGRDSFLVYRGQGLSKTDFEKLVKVKNGLLSFNNFLSTSKKQEVSLGFAESALNNPNTVGILFVISIDPRVTKVPFACVDKVSYFKTEAEVLFSMHTVFRVHSIKQLQKTSGLYQVDLQLTDDDDEQLQILTQRIRTEATGDTGLKRLGNLLLKIGHFNQAVELYKALLDQTCDMNDKGLYYHQLGSVYDHQGDYKKAVEYYDKALEIREKTLPSNHPSLATSYSNIGLVYSNMGEYSKALSYYDKALEIREKTLPSNHPDLATSYSNIGSVYTEMGEYSKALSYYDKALEIEQKTLPSNHPSLATSYSNIGSVYTEMGEYSKALSYYDKALEIEQKTLPSNHPSLATSYSNIGSVYSHMGEYSKALSYYDKALEIQQKTLPSNHPDLATSYGNIGLVYDDMGEYSKALSYFERALHIMESALPANHPHIKTVKGHIEVVKQKL